RVRLHLEALESRVVLSTIHWLHRGDTSGTATDDHFKDVFGDRAQLARQVVDSAILEWTRVIVDLKNATNSIDVFIRMDPAKYTNGASTDVQTDANARPFGATITLGGGDDGHQGGGHGEGWFLDPVVFSSAFEGTIRSAQ